MTTSLALAVLLAAAPAAPSSPAAPPKAAAPTAADAKKFVDDTSAELLRLLIRSSTAEWIKSTYITDDTERNAAALNEDLMAFYSKVIPEAARFDGVKADPDTLRALKLLKLASTMPAPSDPAKRRELADTAAKLEGLYGKGKYCPPRLAKAEKPCLDLQDLEEILAKSKDPKELEEAWTGWHAIAREMKPLYARYVELVNEGAREIGFADAGALWRSGYDMTPAELEKDVDRLWGELKPFYDELHCYARARLQKRYGKELVKDGKPIPADLLGNMWAQGWENVYGDLEPFPGVGTVDLDATLEAQKYDPVKMTKTAEAFYTSLGLDPLPQTFWERSMLTKPRDREVVCHASAWDVTFAADLRIKMCIRPKEEDFVTIHHELGHNYYQRAYIQQPVLFQDSANDGFHEALGDTISPLSMTPTYLKQVGLLKDVSPDPKAVINFQMKKAVEGVAFLPFARLMDQWRWDVFAGKVKPAEYNGHWWALRRKFQGVDAPVARNEGDFDPGAKYHIPANVPYLRYFLARVYQYQFHKALCAAAGWKGDLNACSIYGSKEAGKKLNAMMALGKSKPWQEAMRVLTGQPKADAGPMLEYYKPLREFLKKENAGQKCGW
ncbi:MAG: M2 family metallopeptidase [Anaeromyxobacter sp.]